MAEYEMTEHEMIMLEPKDDGTHTYAVAYSRSHVEDCIGVISSVPVAYSTGGS